jgi:protein TonB
MNRDILLAVSCSLLLHGFVLWIGAHLQHQTSRSVCLPPVLNLSIVKRSIHRAASQGSSAKPTPPLPSPELVTMSRTTPRKAMSESITRTPKIDTRNTLRKGPNSQSIRAPQPVRRTKAILKKLEVPKKIPKRSTPPENLETETTTAPVVPSVSQKADKLKTAPLSERGEQIASLRDSPLAIPGPQAMDKAGVGTTRQASLADQGGAPIVEAVPDYAVNPKPVYPKLAIRRNYHGTVMLLVEVLADGSVRGVEVFESSGYSILDRSALRAVQKWQFKPGTKYGKPVTMKVKVPVVFRLKSQGAG